jgi:hypothetical protein
VHALLRRVGDTSGCIASALGVVASVWGVGACKGHVSREQCDALVEHFADMVVHERMPSADAEVVAKEKAREREEAARDDSFKNCPTELRSDDYSCAMSARTSEALIECLE